MITEICRKNYWTITLNSWILADEPENSIKNIRFIRQVHKNEHIKNISRLIWNELIKRKKWAKKYEKISSSISVSPSPCFVFFFFGILPKEKKSYKGRWRVLVIFFHFTKDDMIWLFYSKIFKMNTKIHSTTH